MTLAVSILDWLLGLNRVSWSDPRAALGWRFAMPLWGWLLVAIAAAALGAWSYRRLLGPRGARVALGVLRAMLVLLLVALLLGPMLVVNQEQVEQDSLLVLVDESASMEIRDMPGRGAGTLVSREQALRAALAQHADLFGDKKLGHDRRIIWLGFHGNTFEINPLAPPTTQPEAERQTTALRTAIEQALQRSAGQPICGLVVMSDGRSPQSTGGALMRRLQQQAVSVFAVPLGAAETPLDLAVGQVDSPEKAFINDAVPVTVYLDHYPTQEHVDPARVRVRLIDTTTGKTLDEQHPGDDQLREPVRLSATSDVVGPAKWRVEVIYDGPGDGHGVTTVPSTHPAGGGELIVENNSRELALELVDQPLGVLYVEGYPRWEYRYLKNILVREKSVRSSMMLISADREFAQEGQVPITRLPATAEELKPYDVIIIGDVPSDFFSPEQLRLFAEHVSARGAGLLWIGGENDTPRSYDGTPWAALLPMRSPGSVSRLDPSLGPIAMQPTKLSETLQVLRLRSNPGAGVSDRAVGGAASQLWPANLPPLFWAQNLGELKTSAEVLASGVPVAGASGPAGRSFPLVARLRYGAGQIVYVGTDETWRWRAGRGELYFEQFWMQLVRMLGRGRLQRGAGRAALSVSTRRAELDEPVVVTVRLQDELLNQRDLPKISVAIIRGEKRGQEPFSPVRDAVLEKIDLAPLPPSGEPGSAGGKVYQAIWRPSAAGPLTLRVVEPALDDLNLAQGIEIVRADDEMRQPAPDRERLATLAAQTGGKVVELDRLDDLEKLIPNRARRTPNDLREPLWNSYLALFVIVILITVEWIGRKMIRLV